MPQRNGVAERKKRSVLKMARTMINDSKLDDKFWGLAVHTTVHILNRGLLKSGIDKTPYELWIERSTIVKHFRVFGSRFCIKIDDRKIGKFESCVDEGIFIAYSSNKKAYKCYNLGMRKVVESINVKIDESSLPITRKEDFDEQEEEEMIQDEEEEEKKKEQEQQDEKESKEGSNQQVTLTHLKTPKH